MCPSRSSEIDFKCASYSLDLRLPDCSLKNETYFGHSMREKDHVLVTVTSAVWIGSYRTTTYSDNRNWDKVLKYRCIDM